MQIFSQYFIFEYILMVYTNQAIKISVSETSFFQPIFAAFAKILSGKFKVWGRLNLNSQLLRIKYSDFVLNLLKVCKDNVFYVSISSVGVFFSNLFRLYEMVCFK